MKTLSKLAPSLKVVADDVAATKLRELLKDADDGFRRVVKAGLYIEWIAANLPQGQFMPWMEAHAPDVGQMTVYRWRTMAKNLCEWSGLKFTQWVNLPLPAEKFLTLPVAELPKTMQAARTKMDEALDSARTPKQLFLDIGFKQGDLDEHGYPRAKRGNKSGKGCTKAMRMKALAVTDRERLEELKLWCEGATERLLHDVGVKGIARLDEIANGRAVLVKFTDAVAYAHSFLQDLKRGRGQL